jgi:hypothetical protein
MAEAAEVDGSFDFTLAFPQSSVPGLLETTGAVTFGFTSSCRSFSSLPFSLLEDAAGTGGGGMDLDALIFDGAGIVFEFQLGFRVIPIALACSGGLEAEESLCRTIVVVITRRAGFYRNVNSYRCPASLT